jgi:hypothetical protein
MEGGLSNPNRRTFLAGMLGTAGLIVAGCDKPLASDSTPSGTQPTTSSAQATDVPSQPKATTSTRPRPQPTPIQTASTQHHHQARDRSSVVLSPAARLEKW